jgi:hypothetical protein
MEKVAGSSSDKKTRIRLLTIPHGMMRYNDAATVKVVREIKETCKSAVPGSDCAPFVWR